MVAAHSQPCSTARPWPTAIPAVSYSTTIEPCPGSITIGKTGNSAHDRNFAATISDEERRAKYGRGHDIIMGLGGRASSVMCANIHYSNGYGLGYGPKNDCKEEPPPKADMLDSEGAGTVSHDGATDHRPRLLALPTLTSSGHTVWLMPPQSSSIRILSRTPKDAGEPQIFSPTDIRKPAAEKSGDLSTMQQQQPNRLKEQVLEQQQQLNLLKGQLLQEEVILQRQQQRAAAATTSSEEKRATFFQEELLEMKAKYAKQEERCVAPEGRRGGGMPAPTMPIVLSPDAAAALSQEHGTQSFHYDPMVREECSGTSTISAEQVARVTEITGDYRTTAWRAPDDIRRREWAHRALEAAFADEPRRL